MSYVDDVILAFFEKGQALVDGLQTIMRLEDIEEGTHIFMPGRASFEHVRIDELVRKDDHIRVVNGFYGLGVYEKGALDYRTQGELPTLAPQFQPRIEEDLVKQGKVYGFK